MENIVEQMGRGPVGYPIFGPRGQNVFIVVDGSIEKSVAQQNRCLIGYPIFGPRDQNVLIVPTQHFSSRGEISDRNVARFDPSCCVRSNPPAHFSGKEKNKVLSPDIDLLFQGHSKRRSCQWRNN